MDTGKDVYLLRKDKLKKCESLQQALTMSPTANLLHRGSFHVPLSRLPEIEKDLLETNPNFKPPKPGGPALRPSMT